MKKTLHIACLTTAAMFFQPHIAAAEEDASTQQTASQQLEPIVVKGEQAAQRADLAPDSPTNLYRVESTARFGTEVFTEKDIQNIHPHDVFDLIDKAAGINLTYQGRRSPFSTEERGGGSFTYIIDGAVLPPSSNRILYKFPVAAIEELQIVRGSTSLTLGPSIPIGASNSGSGLNTGFIIIRTKQPKKLGAVMTASMAKSEGGHPWENSESLYAGSPLKGESPVSGYLGGLIAQMNRPSLDAWFDGRSSENGMGNAGITFGKFNINMMFYRDSGSLEMQRGISTTGVLDNSKWYYDPLVTTIYSSDMAMQWTPNQTTLFNLFQTRYSQTEHNESFANATSSVREYDEDTSGFGLRHNARFGDTLVQVGGQMSNSTGFGPNLSNKYNKYDTTITGWSASVEQKFLDGNLVFDGGFRQDTKHIDNSSTSAAKNKANNDVDTAPANIYALGSRWKFLENYALNGRYFKGDQGTSGDFDMRAQNGKELHGEKQDRIEFGVEAEFTPYFQPTLTWFYIDAKNVKTATDVTYISNGATYYYYTEADEEREGLELAIKGDIGKNTNYKLSWTHLLNSDTTSNGFTTGNIGVSKPENIYAIILGHQWAPYRFNCSLKSVDEWMDSSSPLGVVRTAGIAGYTRFDANIQRDFKLNNAILTTTLFGNNLGDEHYSTRYVTGYYPDRSDRYAV